MADETGTSNEYQGRRQPATTDIAATHWQGTESLAGWAKDALPKHKHHTAYTHKRTCPGHQWPGEIG